MTRKTVTKKTLTKLSRDLERVQTLAAKARGLLAEMEANSKANAKEFLKKIEQLKTGAQKRGRGKQ